MLGFEGEDRGLFGYDDSKTSRRRCALILQSLGRCVFVPVEVWLSCTRITNHLQPRDGCGGWAQRRPGTQAASLDTMPYNVTSKQLSQFDLPGHGNRMMEL